MRNINVHEVIDRAKMNGFFAFIWFACFFSLFFDGYDQGIYGAAMPAMMAEMGFGPEVSGLIGSANLWGAIAGAIIFGILTDKVGRKKIMLVAVLFFSVFTALCATVSTNIYMFTLWRFLSGMGIATITPTTIAMMSEYTPVSKRRFLLVANNQGITLGLVVAPLVGIYIIPEYGWRVMFTLAIIGLAMIPVILKLPETMLDYVAKGDKKNIRSFLTKANPEFVPQEDDEYVVNQAQTEVAKGSVVELFKNGLARNTILIWIMFFVNMIIMSAMNVWLPKIATMMGYSLKSALFMAALLNFGTIIGGIAVAAIANKIGYKKSFVLAYALTAFALFLMTLNLGQNFFIAMVFVYGLVAVYQALIYPFASSQYPISIRATGMGMGGSMTRLGGALSPIIVGVLVGAGVTPVGIYRFLAVPALIGIVAVLLTKPAQYDTK